MKPTILMHEPGDDVGVAVEDLAAGTEAAAVTLEGRPTGSVTPIGPVPLGHKIAMRDLVAGRDVIEYGRPIGAATRDAPRGSHVHTHNLRSKRWPS